MTPVGKANLIAAAAGLAAFAGGIWPTFHPVRPQHGVPVAARIVSMQPSMSRYSPGKVVVRFESGRFVGERLLAPGPAAGCRPGQTIQAERRGVTLWFEPPCAAPNERAQ